MKDDCKHIMVKFVGKMELKADGGCINERRRDMEGKGRTR